LGPDADAVAHDAALQPDVSQRRRLNLHGELFLVEFTHQGLFHVEDERLVVE
jgi:hypothetical protein